MAVYARGNVARERTEEPSKPSCDGFRVPEAGEKGPRRHPRPLRLPPHRRGDAPGTRSQASDCPEERRRTLPDTRRRPRKAYRRSSRAARRPELARYGPRKTSTTGTLDQCDPGSPHIAKRFHKI